MINVSIECFFEKKIYSHEKNLPKIVHKTYILYTKKAENKGKKKLEILKEGKERSGVATMSFIQSRYIIWSSCSAYILFIKSTR